jgi:NAD(P)-dependent dehydrogenase (short-subunit alcohol dehydrogenase family)
VSRSREGGIAWTPQDVPDLTGRRALVTGVTSGLGEATVLELVGRGAEVVMAARNRDKLAAAVADVRRRVPAAVVHPLHVDLADLTSVRRAADEAAAYGPLHLLVNNAGVMATPYQRTADGFELQLGTNHFGPFALTGLLLPLLLESGDARVVTVASQAHRMARRAPLDDPRMPTGRFRRWQAYADSKLANLLFTLELERRARSAGLPLRALAAHPGYASTSLMGAGRTAAGEGDHVRTRILTAAFAVAGQSAEMGALPTLMAATADLPGGTYVGPSGFAEMHGMPKVVGRRRLARDAEAARRLWDLSEQATGVRYP